MFIINSIFFVYIFTRKPLSSCLTVLISCLPVACKLRLYFFYFASSFRCHQPGPQMDGSQRTQYYLFIKCNRWVWICSWPCITEKGLLMQFLLAYCRFNHLLLLLTSKTDFQQINTAYFLHTFLLSMQVVSDVLIDLSEC